MFQSELNNNPNPNPRAGDGYGTISNNNREPRGLPPSNAGFNNAANARRFNSSPAAGAPGGAPGVPVGVPVEGPRRVRGDDEVSELQQYLNN